VSLSSTEILDQVNSSQADFLIVALGAKKGQLWIERNRGSICLPVVSHLGAVINFVAGNIKRAPPWMQRTGLEWTWRIVQEPNLWRRYLSDGLVFSNLFLTKVLPYVLWMKFNKKHFPDLREPVEVKAESEADKSTISISGNCFHDTIEPLRAVFADQANSSRNIVVDLSAVPMVDGAFLGLCLILFKHVSRAGRSLSFSGLNSKVVRVFRWNCVEFLL
jgi:N-acetylglucosaminyldiphosphoundecaprenol N-acetyl-beta-D-mannosaminyltransferase